AGAIGDCLVERGGEMVAATAAATAIVVAGVIGIAAGAVPGRLAAEGAGKLGRGAAGGHHIRIGGRVVHAANRAAGIGGAVVARRRGERPALPDHAVVDRVEFVDRRTAEQVTERANAIVAFRRAPALAEDAGAAVVERRLGQSQ